MNSLLLNKPKAQHILLPLQLHFFPPSKKKQIQIGSNGLHCDYDDNSVQQISWHIWSYISGQASAGGIPTLGLGTALRWNTLRAGTYIHEYVESVGSAMDYLANLVGIQLGTDLHNRTIKPSDFGNYFREAYTKSYFRHLGCTDLECVDDIRRYEGWVEDDIQMNLQYVWYLYRNPPFPGRPGAQPRCSEDKTVTLQDLV